MTNERPAPQLTARAAADLAARREREAAALRANLHRRKQQRVIAAGSPPANADGEEDTG